MVLHPKIYMYINTRLAYICELHRINEGLHRMNEWARDKRWIEKYVKYEKIRNYGEMGRSVRVLGAFFGVYLSGNVLKTRRINEKLLDNFYNGQKLFKFKKKNSSLSEVNYVRKWNCRICECVKISNWIENQNNVEIFN